MALYPLDDDDPPRPYDADDDDAEEGDWIEGDEEVYYDDEDHDGIEDEYVMVRCLACGAEVIAEVGKCPSCGEYTPEMVEAWRGRPWWWIVMGLMGIGAVIYWLSGAWRVL